MAETYGVGTSTISDIKKNRSSIINFVSVLEREDGSASRELMKMAESKDLDDAVFKWFMQQRSVGNPLSGPIVCEKAKMSAEKMVGLSEFKASSGWLRNFKVRRGIQELDLCGEKLSADNNAAENFLEEFKTVTHGYDPEFVYNPDETGLIWKALPRTTLAAKKEAKAPGHKVSKHRVTILTFANTSGSHRIPLLLIGKSKKHRAFKNAKTLPLVYKSQPRAWMTASLFTEWYDEVFIPAVKKHQNASGKKGDVLLLFDNAPTHPSVDLLGRDNGRFKVFFCHLM